MEALGVIVVLLTIVSLWPEGLWPRSLPEPKISVLTSDVLSSGVPSTWAISQSPDNLTAPPDADPCSDKVAKWMASESVRGVPIGDHITVVLSSERPESVVVTGIKAYVKRVEEKSQAVAVTCQGGNGIIIRGARLVVDEESPKFQFYDENAEEIDTLRINLGKGDAAEIALVVEAQTPGGIYEWSADIEMLVAGTATRMRLDDDGKPFRVAAPLPNHAPTWVYPGA